MKDSVYKILNECKNTKLIAVSKTKPIEMIKEVYDLGIRDFGENKVQELLSKIDKLPNDIRWHLIGHLQTNKVKYIIDKVYLIHSVDSVKLASIIDEYAKKKGIVVNILCEINIAGEESKYGFSISEFESSIEDIKTLKNINLIGLMCVAPYQENPEDNRVYFRNLKSIADKYNLKE